MRHLYFNTFYGFLIKLLRKPFFRSFALFFSHGGIHFIFLLVIGIIIAWLWKNNNNEKIIPHNMGVFVGYLSTYKEDLRQLQLKNETIENVNIDIVLNSDNIKQSTNGEFANGVLVSFDGKTVKRVLHRQYIDTTSMIATRISEETFLDSVVVSLYSIPFIKLCATNISIDDNLGSSDIFVDSVTGLPTRKIYIAGNTDISYNTVANRDGSIAMYIAPKSFEKGKTRHHVTFLSNEIGVKDNDPYYYYYISFPTFEFSGDLKISFSVSDVTTGEHHNGVYSQNKNLQYNFIYPQPDIIGNGYLSYFSPEKKEQLRKNGGVVIQAVDINALNYQNRMSFFVTVLIGTGLAFILDIFIQLIRELRRLQLRGTKLEKGK